MRTPCDMAKHPLGRNGPAKRVNSGGERVRCAVCHSDQTVPVLAGLRHGTPEGRGEWNYSLMRCGECGLGFVHPSPSPALVQSFYTTTYGSYVPAAPGSGSAHYAKFVL